MTRTVDDLDGGTFEVEDVPPIPADGNEDQENVENAESDRANSV